MFVAGAHSDGTMGHGASSPGGTPSSGSAPTCPGGHFLALETAQGVVCDICNEDIEDGEVSAGCGTCGYDVHPYCVEDVTLSQVEQAVGEFINPGPALAQPRQPAEGGGIAARTRGRVTPPVVLPSRKQQLVDLLGTSSDESDESDDKPQPQCIECGNIYTGFHCCVVCKAPIQNLRARSRKALSRSRSAIATAAG